MRGGKRDGAGRPPGSLRRRVSRRLVRCWIGLMGGHVRHQWGHHCAVSHEGNSTISSVHGSRRSKASGKQ